VIFMRWGSINHSLYDFNFLGTAMSSLTHRYLERAMQQLRSLGLVPDKPSEAPIVSLLQRITDIDEDKVIAIARTLSQASLFNEVVREQLGDINLGNRYEDLAAQFNSIRDDAKRMVEQLDDGKLSTFEQLSNMWMQVTRGDVSDRFAKIKSIFLEVGRDSRDQIEREQLILSAYQDFRASLKESEIYALEVLAKAETLWETAKKQLQKASDLVESFEGEGLSERAKLELARDESLRALQYSEDRYQIAKDISDNLSVGYNTSEVVMLRLKQTTTTKERVYKQSIAFFGTNETVLTALSASFKSLFGLHESTQALETMKDGVSQGLEDLADIGGKVQEAAIKAGLSISKKDQQKLSAKCEGYPPKIRKKFVISLKPGSNVWRLLSNGGTR